MKILQVSIQNLLLDPNNYRLRGEENYKFVDDKNISNVMVQKRVLKMLKGDSSSNIKDLLDSFKENGYLKIDNIIVREVGKQGFFAVVEGNRRVATLKALKESYEDGMEIGNLDPDIFENLDVILYDVDEKGYEILMGLRHVSGIKEWGDFEQSELISNLARRHQMSAKEISDALGIPVRTVKRRLNTYYAMEIFSKDSEYGEYFSPNKLSVIFYEIMGQPNLRDQWLGWDESLNAFTHKNNMRRLFSWLVPAENEEGDKLDPIITKRDDIRALKDFISDEEALTILEENRSVGAAKEESQVYSKEGLKKSLKQIARDLGKLNLAALSELTSDDKKILDEILEKLNNQSALIRKLIQ